jgi:hypothetical protein
MPTIPEFKTDITAEVSTILSSNFSIDVTETSSVPHSSDPAITFPNLDAKTQGTKLIETAVLYVDMRRSTALSMQHRKHTVAKLYSAFVRAMTRCAAQFNGEVRGIIGDRVMILFNSTNCFTEAVDTAVLINSVCQYIINKHFQHNEVTFGIGIDYGPMLAAKTGIRRHGAAQQSYRSLVWLGRPANVASKLTDQANKPADISDVTKLKVAYNYGLLGLTYVEEWAHDFVKSFTFDPMRGMMVHSNSAFHSFTVITAKHLFTPATPPILMTKAVYDGYKSQRPNADAIKNNWYKQIDIKIPECTDPVFGGDVHFIAIKQ